MRILFLNGSPNAERGNSQIFIDHFVKGISSPYESMCIAQKDPQEVADYMRQFDYVFIFMPLYIHAMPGIVMKLLEVMKPNPNQHLGFLIQLGFSESSQARYATSLLEHQSKRLGSNYLGTMVCPGAAGIKMMPEKANQSLFEKLSQLGTIFEKTKKFDSNIKDELSVPYVLSPSKLRLYNALSAVRAMDMMWFMMLKQNHAFRKRNDQPFLNKNKSV